MEPMEEVVASLNHFAFFRFEPAYFELRTEQRQALNQGFLGALRRAAGCVQLYQVHPTRPGVDFVAWSAVRLDTPTEAANFFTRFTRFTTPFRNMIAPTDTLWGMTKPSQYSKARSAQEIDPFSEQRHPYLVIYPFSKTGPWYLMSREARQGMMNEHIRIGKSFSEIQQLLLYSFGLQDQEFVVVYDTPDLEQFSDLVYELRSTEARRYTERDTPVYTAIHHPADQTLALWE